MTADSRLQTPDSRLESEPNQPIVDRMLDEVDLDLWSERFPAAKAKLAALDFDTLAPDAWARATVRMLRCRVLDGEPMDRAIVDARRALERVDERVARARFHLEIAYGLTAKRCEKLAKQEIECAREAWPEDSAWAVASGWVALRFDRREEAERLAEQGTGLTRPHVAHLLLARIHYVCGRFDAAQVELAHCTELPDVRVQALRLESDIARVQGDWTAVLERVGRILSLTEGGVNRRRDQLDRASALFATGRADDGTEVYKALWCEDEVGWEGRFARAVLNHLERRDGTTKGRLMLRAFPTVEQKRNYCGPASLELVLRAAGIDLGQDAIAEKVKGEHGSALIAMTSFLEGNGLATRRFEADAHRFRTCLELGLPLVVQEEYSTTSHVAVVIGIDEGLGLLFVQDPMTHVTSERLLDTQGSLGKMYRNAVIVAFPRADEAKARALDAAGVLDCEHIRLTDECALPDVEADQEEVVSRSDRAIALQADYPLAWHHRTNALFQLHLRYRTVGYQARFLAALREARSRFFDQEWTHQVHGWYLKDEGRFEEAIIELTEALRLDPGDSNNAQYIAECHMELQRDQDATEAYWKALSIDPAHVRGTENFASHALRTGDLDLADHLSACAREANPTNPFNWMVASEIAEKRGAREDAIALARRCVEVSPTYTFGQTQLAKLLEGSTDPASLAEALDVYSAQSTSYPLWFAPRRCAARLLQRLGRIEEATSRLVSGIEIAQDEPSELLQTLTAILLEAGDTDAAVVAAERFARERPTNGMLDVLFDTLADADRYPRLLEVLRDHQAQQPSRAYACALLGERLFAFDPASDEESRRLLEEAIRLVPTYGWARCRLARQLAWDGTRVDEALAVLGAHPETDAWVEHERASLLAELGRWDEAAAALGAVLHDYELGWTGQEVFHRVMLRDDDPATALDRLRDGEPTPPVRRAQLACLASLRRIGEMPALLETLSADDVGALYLLTAAAEGCEDARPLLETRIEPVLCDPTTSHGTRRWLSALLAGSRAARGDRTEFDRVLGEEKNPHQIADLSRSLSADRHQSLVEELRSAASSRPEVRAIVWLARADLAGSRGRHDEALDALRTCTERFPHAGAWAPLALEILLSGPLDPDRLDAAEAAARRASRSAAWVSTHEALGLIAFLRGDRAEADRRAKAAFRLSVASGYPIEVFPLTVALRAALAGDADRLHWARRQPNRHWAPDAPLWERMM